MMLCTHELRGAHPVDAMRGRKPTLADIMKAKDDAGHEHGADGRFATNGGAGAPSGSSPEPWRENAYAKEGKVDLMPISHVKKYRGNALREDVTDLAASIKEHGIREPLIMEFGRDDHTMFLGEGNHRLAAAEKAGHTHVPVRMLRSSSLDHPAAKPAPMSRVVPGKYFSGDAAPSDVLDNFDAIGGVRGTQTHLNEEQTDKVLDTQLHAKMDAGTSTDADVMASMQRRMRRWAREREQQTEKARTLDDIMKVKDATGHEHGADGRFGGGSSGAKKPPKAQKAKARTAYLTTRAKVEDASCPVCERRLLDVRKQDNVGAAAHVDGCLADNGQDWGDCYKNPEKAHAHFKALDEFMTPIAQRHYRRTHAQTKTEKTLTLEDIMKVRDEEGHEHGDDGKFTSQGGGGAKAKPKPGKVNRTVETSYGGDKHVMLRRDNGDGHASANLRDGVLRAYVTVRSDAPDEAYEDLYAAIGKEAQRSNATSIKLTNVESYDMARCAVDAFGPPINAPDDLHDPRITSLEFNTPEKPAPRERKPVDPSAPKRVRPAVKAEPYMNHFKLTYVDGLPHKPFVTFAGLDTWDDGPRAVGSYSEYNSVTGKSETPTVAGRYESLLAGLEDDKDIRYLIDDAKTHVGHQCGQIEESLNVTKASPQARGLSRKQYANIYYDNARLKAASDIPNVQERKNYLVRTAKLAAAVATLKPKTVQEAVEKLAANHDASGNVWDAKRDVAREALMYIHNVRVVDSMEDSTTAAHLFPTVPTYYTDIRPTTTADMQWMDEKLTGAFGDMARSHAAHTFMLNTIKPGNDTPGCCWTQHGHVSLGVFPQKHDFDDRYDSTVFVHEFCHAFSQSSLRKEMTAFNAWMRPQIQGARNGPTQVQVNVDGTRTMKRSAAEFITDHGYNSKDHLKTVQERDPATGYFGEKTGDFHEDWAIGLSELILHTTHVLKRDSATSATLNLNRTAQGPRQVRRETADKLAELLHVKSWATPREVTEEFHLMHPMPAAATSVSPKPKWQQVLDDLHRQRDAAKDAT